MAETTANAPRPRFEVVLDVGTVVHIRPIEAGDRDGLLAAFERLSARSRQLRFMVGKGGLSEAEVRFYTEPDGDHHYAIGAIVVTDGIEREGIGTARFVRLDEDSTTAEVAVTVVDDWQRAGVGTLGGNIVLMSTGSMG